jgi:hypothetical protein
MKRQLKRAQDYIVWMDSKLYSCVKQEGQAGGPELLRPRGMWGASFYPEDSVTGTHNSSIWFDPRKYYDGKGQLSGHIRKLISIARQE